MKHGLKLLEGFSVRLGNILCILLPRNGQVHRDKAEVNHRSAGHVNSLGIGTFLLLLIVSRFAKWIKVNLEPMGNLWYHNGEALIK